MTKTFKVRAGGSKSQIKSDLKKFEKAVAQDINKIIEKELRKLK